MVNRKQTTTGLQLTQVSKERKAQFVEVAAVVVLMAIGSFWFPPGTDDGK